MKHMLKKGDSGEQVKEVQHWLNVHGYKAGEEDGVFGEKTRAAVIQFQSEKSILTNGIVNPQTQVVMKRISKQE